LANPTVTEFSDILLVTIVPGIGPWSDILCQVMEI